MIGVEFGNEVFYLVVAVVAAPAALGGQRIGDASDRYHRDVAGNGKRRPAQDKVRQRSYELTPGEVDDLGRRGFGPAIEPGVVSAPEAEQDDVARAAAIAIDKIGGAVAADRELTGEIGCQRRRVCREA